MLVLGQDRASAWSDVVMLVVVAATAYFLTSLFVGLLIGPDPTGIGRAVHFGSTLVWGLLVMGFAISMARLRGQPLESLGLSLNEWWLQGLLGVSGAVAAWAILLGFWLVLVQVAPDWEEALRENPERITDQIPRLHPVWLCAVSLVVGMYEEVIFRGFILTRLRRATGSVVAAVMLSAVLFGLPHGATQVPITIIPILLIGVAWGVLTWWQRSLVPAIVAHTLFNLGQFIALYYTHSQWE